MTRLIDRRIAEEVRTYRFQDTILYALSIGVGRDPLDPRQLQFVYEQDLATFPTMPLVLCPPKPWYREAGIDAGKVVHGEQSLEVLAPLPVDGTVKSRTSITGLIDRGSEKGLVIFTERDLVSGDDGTVYARMRSTSIARGDGGKHETTTEAPPPSTVPERAADGTILMPTDPSIAAVYRLNADLNPLHIDPDFAKLAGFERPILHGLATMGLAAHALVRELCDYNPLGLRSIGQRFSAPIFPGETLQLEYWRTGNEISFRAFAAERAAKVLDNGFAVLAA